MFFFKVCHSVGIKIVVSFFFGGVHICRTGFIVTMQKPKIGSNSDFKHCCICCQLENSAFELCEISSPMKSSYSHLALIMENNEFFDLVFSR